VVLAPPGTDGAAGEELGSFCEGGRENVAPCGAMWRGAAHLVASLTIGRITTRFVLGCSIINPVVTPERHAITFTTSQIHSLPEDCMLSICLTRGNEFFRPQFGRSSLAGGRCG
jgi:hypothetical protein